MRRTISALMLCAACAPALGQQARPAARALGMGGAFTALSDDIYGPLWNPAAAARFRRVRFAPLSVQAALSGPRSFSELLDNFPSDTDAQVELGRRLAGGVSRAEFGGAFALGLPNLSFSLVPFANGVVTPRDPAGRVGFAVGAGPGGLPLVPDGSTVRLQGVYGYQAALTYGRRAGRRTHAGASARLSRYTPADVLVRYDAAAPDGAVVTDAEGAQTTALSFDFGVLHEVSDRLTVGASLQNLFGPNDPRAVPTLFSLGAAFRPARGVTVAADLADMGGTARLNLGAEWNAGVVALRAGVYRGRPTVGLGLFNALNVGYTPDGSTLAVSLGF